MLLQKGKKRKVSEEASYLLAESKHISSIFVSFSNYLTTVEKY